VTPEERAASKIALRFNADKLRYDLIPADALEELVRVYTQGAAKYAPRNWEKGFDWMSVYASLMRHLQAWAQGEDRDPETGRLHMSHVEWNAQVLVAFTLRGHGVDDRPPRTVDEG
jgi:hypothetical protein